MGLKSIRWRLPLSFAGIALLSVVALGLVLNIIIRSYYQLQEMNYLQGNARQIATLFAELVQAGLPPDELDNQVKSLSFLLQARIQVLGPDRNVLADSGIPDARQNLVVSSIKGPEMVVSSVNRNGGVPIKAQGSASGMITLPTWGLFLVNPGGTKINPVPAPIVDCSQVTPANDGMNGNLCGGGQVQNQSANPVPDQANHTNANPVPDPGSIPNVSATPVGPGNAPDTAVGVAIQMSSTLFGFNLAPDKSVANHRSSAAASISIDDKSGNPVNTIIISDGPAYGQEIESWVAQGWLVAGLFAVLLAGGVGLRVSRRMTAPLIDLSETAASMASGDLSSRANVLSSDEFGELSQTFNGMADRVEEMIGTLRGFVADAAHQLMTPLTALRTNLELAEEETDPADRSAYLAAAQNQLIRMEAMVRELLELSRIEANGFSSAFVQVDLSQAVLETAETAASRAEQTGKQFSLDLPEERIVLVGDSGRIHHAVDNLLDNAFKYTPAGGRIHLGLSTEGKWAILVVKDNGSGIPEEDQPHLFKRFYRGKNSADIQGSGLGLAIVKAIMNLHGGQIHIKSSEQGTEVELHFPLPNATE